MPYGQSWPKFLTFTFVAFLSAAAGSQMVHNYFQPLSDMNDLVLQTVERKKVEMGIVDDDSK